MKNLIKSLTLVVVLTVVGAGPTRAGVIANGSFEQASGTVTSPPNVVDSTTITGWRVFDVDSANVSYKATIIANASAGSHALRLDVTNNTGSSSYALDQDGGRAMHTAAVYGQRYIVSFDAAWIAGATANNLVAYMIEYDSSGAFTGTQLTLGTLSVSATGYTTYTFLWTPGNTNTVEIGFGFRPMAGVTGTTSLSLDNVQLAAATTYPVNGSFEFQPNGASVSAPPNVINATTIGGWRVFDVDSANVTFSATIIANASVGSHAIRLTAANSTGSSSYALDQWERVMHTPVVYGKRYIVSFDAAWISGATVNNLLAYVQEYKSDGTFNNTSANLGVVSVSATGYKTYSFVWTPQKTDTTELGAAFTPMAGAVGNTSVSLDNVRIAELSTLPQPWNGSFEYSTAGATVTAPQGGGDVVNGTTLVDWRFVRVTSANATFSASIITNASAGRQALRLDLSASGDPNWIDQWDAAMQTPVAYGQTYLVSADAAWISGTTPYNLVINAQEFNSSGATYLQSEGIGTASASSTNYTKYAFLWTPQNSSAGSLSLSLNPSVGSASVDNIQVVNVTNLSTPLNGSFEYSLMGTASTSGTGGAVDATTFMGWRLFNVGSPAIVGFTGTVVDAGNYTGGTPGSHAMRLDVNNTGSPAANDYALDTDNNRIPVTPGKHYNFSFDLELDGVSGDALALAVGIAEYNAGGTYIGAGVNYTPAPPRDQAFHHYSVGYVASANAAKVVLAFRPRNPGYVSAVVLDNVVFAPGLTFTNLTASPSVAYGTTGVTLAGKLSAEGPVYPTNGATITVTINGNAQTTTINDATGDFSFSYNPSTIPYSATPYTITYAYAGSSSLNPASDTSTALTVNKKALTIGAPTIASKAYDGTATAGPVTVGTLSGFVGSETVTATGAAANYSSANANSYPGVVVTYTLANGTGGGLAANYSLAAGTATGQITQKELSVTEPTVTKVYDGGTSAGTVTVGTLSEFVGTETVTATGAATSYSSRNVGPAYSSTVSYTLANGNNGGLAANYSVANSVIANAAITARALTITAAANSKPYDGGTTAATAATLTGTIQSGDTAPTWTESYSSKDVGTSLTLNPAHLVVSDGNGGNNYSYTYTSQNNGTITQATTTGIFTSSLNPSLPGADVIFTATVTNAVPGGPVPAGDVQFKTNGVALCDPVALDGSGLSAFVTNSLPHGSNTVVAEFAGDGNFQGVTNSVVQVVNTPPTAANSNAGVPENTNLVLSIAKLLTTAGDADGDALSVTAAGPTSTNGPANNIVLNTGAGTITYTPATGYVGSDSFTYAVSDNYGGTTNATVYVTVTGNSGGSPNVVVPPTYSGGTFRVTFAGIPNYEYTIEYADSPTGPWSYLKKATAGTNGLFEVVDVPLPETPARYYRTVYP